MKIALTADHAGYEQVRELREFLEDSGYLCLYFGPKNFDETDDYPDFVRPAAEAVAKGDCQFGIIIGGSGQGEAMAANRVPGVRCAVFYGPAVPRRSVDAEGNVSHDPYEIVRLSRRHNDANMLSFGGRFVSLEEVKRVSKLWLLTPFSHNERHARRNTKLDEGGSK